MNCEPFGRVFNDSTVTRASPYWYAVAVHQFATHTTREMAMDLRLRMQLLRAVQADDARYMEAVRR